MKREKGALRLPPALAPGASHMEIGGNREVVLEGCGGVLEYSETAVRVRAGRLVVRFTGRGLSLRCLTADSLVVEGFLTGIEFLT